jgi:hypothetical protein
MVIYVLCDTDTELYKIVGVVSPFHPLYYTLPPSSAFIRHPPPSSALNMSDHASPSPSGESEISSPPIVPHVAEMDTFTITRDDATILEEYVDEFQEGDADLRNTIIANVMAELCALRPEALPFNKIEATKVCFYLIMQGTHKLIFHSED